MKTHIIILLAFLTININAFKNRSGIDGGGLYVPLVSGPGIGGGGSG